MSALLKSPIKRVIMFFILVRFKIARESALARV
jgi:hypothetical protein